MRLTVGPLPASVYWRRRAVVLGGALCAVIVGFYSCGSTSGSPLTTPTGGTTVAGAVSTFSPPASVKPSGSVGPTRTASAPVVVGADPRLCSDEEIAVTAKASPATMTVGSTIVLYLLIKNVGNRTCTRDIGPDLQELWIVKGTERVWSSDDCDAPRGNSLKTFTQNLEVSFNVAWNGRYSTTCTVTVPKHADGDRAPAGEEYRLFARVGTKTSAPVKITIN